MVNHPASAKLKLGFEPLPGRSGKVQHRVEAGEDAGLPEPRQQGPLGRGDGFRAILVPHEVKAGAAELASSAGQFRGKRGQAAQRT